MRVLCFALCMPTLVSTCVGFNRSAYKCRSSSLTLISTYFGYWLVWGFPLMSLSHDMVRLPRVEKVAWFWRGGWGSETGVPLFPISYQYLNCLFQAWALQVDVSRANHSFRCLFGSFLTWLWSFSNQWEAVTFLVEIHLLRISLTFLSVGQFGFSVVGDVGFFVLLYVCRLL